MLFKRHISKVLIITVVIAIATTITPVAAHIPPRPHVGAEAQIVSASTVSVTSTFSVVGSDACGHLIEPVTFTDTGSLASDSVAAINCLAHYNITQGTSPTTYEPFTRVTRLQTAYFLVRTIKALDLPLPDGPSQPFNDLGSVGTSGQLAIAGLHELDIIEGHLSGRFVPYDNVGRAQTAMLLLRLLEFAEVQLPEPSDVDIPDFDDLHGWPASTVIAIRQLVTLGIMQGVTADSFGPDIPITREDMALLLARVLETAEAQPVKLQVSASPDSVTVGGSSEITITALKPNGKPYRGLLIDVFAAYNGKCHLARELQLNGGDAGTSQNCRIDSGDPRSDVTGTVKVGVTINTPYSGKSRIYAWVGALGQTFDGNKVRTSVYTTFHWHASPTEMAIFVSSPSSLGENTTVHAHLIGPNSQGKRLIFIARDSDNRLRSWQFNESDDSGWATFELASPAYSGSRNNQQQPLTDTVVVFWDRNGNNTHDGLAELSAQATLTWQ